MLGSERWTKAMMSPMEKKGGRWAATIVLGNRDGWKQSFFSGSMRVLGGDKARSVVGDY